MSAVASVTVDGEVPASVSMTWELSPTFGKIFAALAKAQRVMLPAKKSGTGHAGPNGNREYKYSTIDDVIEAIREPLGANGIARFQTTEPAGPNAVSVITWLGFEGEYIRTRLWMPCEGYTDNKTGKVYPPDTQDFGKALSYARRYALQAITGLPAEDNDAAPEERAAPPQQARTAQPQTQEPAAAKASSPAPAAPVSATATSSRRTSTKAAPAEMSEKERNTVEMFGPIVARTTDDTDLRRLNNLMSGAVGGVNVATKAYLDWHRKTFADARNRIRGPAKAGAPHLAIVPSSGGAGAANDAGGAR